MVRDTGQKNQDIVIFAALREKLCGTLRLILFFTAEDRKECAKDRREKSILFYFRFTINLICVPIPGADFISITELI